MSADEWTGLGKFDVVLALDVLEHLVDPWRAVRALSSVTEPAGTFVASIPNVRSHGVLFPLLFRGEWSYTECGLLDRTHLRFFTKRSALELVETAFTVRNVKRNWSSRARFVNALTLGMFSDFLTTQYLLQATPKPHMPLNAYALANQPQGAIASEHIRL